MLFQSWNVSTWLHWPFDPEVVARRLPPGLELDTFDGRAWVGLVAFVIENQRPAGMPRIPWMSRAQETHLRTYVTAPDGRSGSYFIYLENGLLPAVLAGRAGFFLRYAWDRMELVRRGDAVEYRGRRVVPPRTEHDLRVEVGQPYRAEELSTLDHFVTAQWILFTRYGPRLSAVLVDHPRWPLWRARVEHLEEGLFRAAGLPPPDTEPLVHFSPGVDARIAFPRLVRPAERRASGDRR